MTSENETTSKLGLRNIWNSIRTSSKPNRNKIILSLCLGAIVTIAILLRILPMAWGTTLTEFDPFFQYEQTKYVVDNGFGAWYSWHTTTEWYPSGRNIGTSSFPGVAFSGAAVYYATRALGLNVSVMDVAIFFPILAAAITCVVIFFLGREVGGNGVGLLAALFLAISPAYIGRTTLGWYDDETIGILGILLVALFYLRALKSKSKLSTSLMYSIAAGLGLGYVSISWGASRYLIALLALFTFFLIFTKVAGTQVTLSYGILIAIGLGIAITVPKLGFGFLKEFETVASVGILLLLILNEASKRFAGRIGRPALMSLFILVLVGAGIALWQLGIVNLSPVKFMSVINPFFRSDIPIIESVGENVITTWATFYYHLGALVVLAPLGMYFSFRKFDYKKLFMVIFALTMLYFSSTSIRLTAVLAPAFAILGALALVEIIKPFSVIMFQRNTRRRRHKLIPKLGKGTTIFLIITIFALTAVPFTRAVDSAYAPTTLVSSSIPTRQQIGDWMQALQWMKDNLPTDTVVAAWWDYGYWISIVAEKITLADNGTINMTQIAQIGKMFMSTENESLPILKSFNADYVLVFTTINQAQAGNYLFGDEVKWRWMARIGWNNNTMDKAFADTSITSLLGNSWLQQTTDPTLINWYNQFKSLALPKNDTVLTKLMLNGAYPGINASIPELTLQHFQPAFASERNFVLVYKIIYS